MFDIIKFVIWLLRNARYDKSRQVWIAVGYRALDSRLVRIYGQSIIFCQNTMSFEFFHELGHHVLGHCSDCGVSIRDLTYEMLADEFAVDIIGIDAAVSRLKSLRDFAKEKGFNVNEIDARIYHLS